MLPHGDLYYPDFDLGEFRYATARYVKLLIRARWKCDPAFRSLTDLAGWGLTDIAEDRWKPATLMEQAASALAHLNINFLPRCGSGGVKETDHTTPVGRLISSIVDLVPTEGSGPQHNSALQVAAKVLADGKALDWPTLALWSTLPAIRADLDLLPHPKKAKPDARLDKIEAHVPPVRCQVSTDPGRKPGQGGDPDHTEAAVCAWQEAMNITGLKKTKLYDLFHAGVLKGYRDGKMIRFYRKGLHDYMRERENVTALPSRPARRSRAKAKAQVFPATGFRFL